MTFEEFLRAILQVLEAAGVDYLIGGVVAVWPWGEPRSTQDIDLVVKLSPDAVNTLSGELEKVGILLPPEIILDNLVTTVPFGGFYGNPGGCADQCDPRHQRF